MAYGILWKVLHGLSNDVNGFTSNKPLSPNHLVFFYNMALLLCFVKSTSLGPLAGNRCRGRDWLVRDSDYGAGERPPTHAAIKDKAGGPEVPVDGR